MSKSLKNFITIDVCCFAQDQGWLDIDGLVSGNSAKIYRTSIATCLPYATMEYQD